MDTQLIPLSFIVLAFAQLLIVIFVWRLAKLLESDSYWENKARAYGMLDRAYKKASGIVGEAELEGVKLAAQSKLETKKLVASYEAEVDAGREKLERAFLVEADKAYEAYANYLTKLEDYTGKTAADSLAKFQKATEAKITAELEAYKKEKMAEFEANLPTLLEKTLALVVPKTIKLQDQMELVSDALEKAKWISLP